MEILQPMWEIGKCLWIPLKRQINYVKKFQENFENLIQKGQDLYARRTDIERAIESERGSKIPTNECEVWLKKVSEVENKVYGMEAEFRENKRCLGEWCPNIWWRMKLGKRIMTMIDDIAKLKEKSKFEGGVLVVAPLRTVEPTPTPTIEVDTSTGCTLREILGCLRNEKIGKIGVWGMGGVGKTTVLKNLNTSPEIILMFQIVIWVTVSKDWSVKKVQKDIAERLSLTLENNESDDGVSRKIFQKLGTLNYLLLFDDVWNTIDLEAIGVPHPTGENGCKIVLTSRFLNVCRKMETDMDIKVEVLSEKEAWDLFHKKVGDVVDCSYIEPLARKVVKECGGLPLLLVVIGVSLRKVNNIHVWSNAVTELGRSTFQIDDDMEKAVFMRLKFSYDQLKDDNVKNCFLYCSLYPEDFEIPVPELIEHWWVERFIGGKLNFGEAYDKGHAILNDLINASLLEGIEDYRFRLVGVKMHDVIRDLALRITYSEGDGLCRFVVKAGDGITVLPNDEEWEQAEKMSLMRSDLTFLPKRPNCTFLRTLLLQNNSKLKEIPDSFYEDMHSLRILNLSGTDIKELPSSLFNLTSLQGLFLGSYQNLDIVPSGIGQLTRLEVLHIGGWIKYLPVEVGELTRLKSLRVEFVNNGSETPPSHIIPEGLLSRLTLLEDLRINMDTATLALWLFVFETEGVAEELVNLKQLISLHFHFPAVEYLEHFLQRSCHWKEGRFKLFKFFVPLQCAVFSGDGQLELAGDDGIFSDVIREVLSRSSHFGLNCNKSCRRLSDLCSMEMMKGLQSCYMNECNAIETVIDGIGLPNLEDLCMQWLPELTSIWEGPVPPQSVTFLRRLSINGCPKLNKIFSRGMIQHLSNLEELYIWSSEIEEIVSEEDMAAMVAYNEEDVEVVLFPRLKEMRLHDNTKLVRICERVPKPTAWPSLEVLDIYNSPNLKDFPARTPALTQLHHQALRLEYEDGVTKQLVNNVFETVRRAWPLR